MPRAIYQKKIYQRANQLDRKVYQRKNNVIPVYSGKFVVSTVTLTAAGKDYQVDDELTITGGESDTASVITVKTVNPTTYQIASATASGTMSGYETDETITILGAEGDTAAVLTITAEAGAITALTVTTAGEYAEDPTGEITTYTYEGSGTGLELTVVGEETSTSGGIDTFEFTAGEYATNLSGSKSLDSTTGSGAIFNVVMTDEIIGDDEDLTADSQE